MSRLILCCSFLLLAACERAPQVQRLSDGTEIFYQADSSVQPAPSYPTPREIHVDGEAFIRVSTGPLIIRSRLMQLTVSPNSALKIHAYSKQTGEEADMLYGSAVAQKAYPSNEHEPNTLSAGDAIMINRTIDFQEKDQVPVEPLRAWSQALIAAARPR